MSVTFGTQILKGKLVWIFIVRCITQCSELGSLSINMKSFVIFVACVVSGVFGAPSARIMPETVPPQLLTLPSNATSIRSEITDSFSCEGRSYGYYADVENDCQIFHVCLPILYSTGREQTFKWSFICPDETVFNQEVFSCTRSDESIDCKESPRYYMLNSNFGDVVEDNEEDAASPSSIDSHSAIPEVSQNLEDKRGSLEAAKRSFSYH